MFVTRRAILLALFAAGCAGPSAAPPRVPGTLELRCGVAAFADVNPLADIDRLAAWGADYAEIALSKAAALSDEDFAAAKRKVDASRIRVEAANWFVPGDVKLTGPAVDPAKTRAYLEKALARAESLGVKVVVFGSPGARSVPDGFPMAQAWGQLKAFLGQCADVIEARGYGMVIAIEPLRRQESNIVNTAAEGLRLAREVNRAPVRLHVDFYHLAVENEDPAILLEAKDWIVHLHIAEPKERLLVRDASQDPRLAAFFANLKAIGYRGRISVEGNVKNPEEDIRAGLTFLRAMAEKYR
jgi:sugar phosphate isomerase/epimerase